MRLPRDLSGAALIKRLARLSYLPPRHTGSHVRLTTSRPSSHHITVPLRVGTLAGILAPRLPHHGLSRDHLIARLFE